MQGSCLEELCFVWFSEKERGKRLCVGAGEFCHLTFIGLEVSKYRPLSSEGRTWATSGALSVEPPEARPTFPCAVLGCVWEEPGTRAGGWRWGVASFGASQGKGTLRWLASPQPWGACVPIESPLHVRGILPIRGVLQKILARSGRRQRASMRPVSPPPIFQNWPGARLVPGMEARGPCRAPEAPSHPTRPASVRVAGPQVTWWQAKLPEPPREAPTAGQWRVPFPCPGIAAWVQLSCGVREEPGDQAALGRSRGGPSPAGRRTQPPPRLLKQRDVCRLK